MMDEIYFLWGQLKKIKKKLAAKVDQLFEEKRELRTKCWRFERQAEKTWGLTSEMSRHQAILWQFKEREVALKQKYDSTKAAEEASWGSAIEAIVQ